MDTYITAMGIAGLRVAMTQLSASTHDYINIFTCT
jgi:hypothetical protein